MFQEIGSKMGASLDGAGRVMVGAVRGVKDERAVATALPLALVGAGVVILAPGAAAGAAVATGVAAGAATGLLIHGAIEEAKRPELAT